MNRRVPARALLVLVLATPELHAQSVAEAQARVAKQDFAGARTLLEARLAQAPDDAGARFLLARVRAWQGDPASALPLYRALLADTPDNADYLLGYGQALLWAGQRNEAIRTLERAHALAPGYADVTHALQQAREAQATAPPEASSTEAAMPPSMPDPVSTSPAPGTGPAMAATPRPSDPERATRLAYALRHERLDRGYDDWRSHRIELSSTGRGRIGGYGALVADRRFGLEDEAVELGLVLPLGADWVLQPEAGFAPGARFLPRRYLDLRLQRGFANGWVGAAGVRRSTYREADVSRLAIGTERYAGEWRMGYTLNLTRLGGHTASSHDLRVVRGYGERGEIGVQFVFGREDALLGPQVVTGNVRAVSIGGRHAFTADWALRWNLGSVRQADLYTRHGAMLGVERRF